MKKFLLIISAIIVSLGINSCNSCQRESEQTNVTEEDSTIVATLAEPEILISLDRERMYTEYGGNYRWYETSVVLKDYLDEENDGTVSGVSNIFQVVREMEGGADVFVVMFTHVGDTTDTQIAHSFWIEDFPLNSEEEQGPAFLTFRQAYEKLMETNIPKPHSRQAVLRKEVGPLDANPQWIFGNQEAHVYVDAKTGEVRSWNPVFPQNQQLGYAFTW